MKFFVFSDESGSWHEEDESAVYVRAWVILEENDYIKIKNRMQEIASFHDCGELKWKTIANLLDGRYLTAFSDIDFRIYITITSPCDIGWDTKYKVTANFTQSISGFDFGDIGDNLKSIIKKKVFQDIKHILFLNYYEKTHIKNAVENIEKIINPTDYDLFYRIDPPQSNKKDWGEILNSITDKGLEFPKSQRDEGIQFADIVAGAIRSLIVEDDNLAKGVIFFKENKKKFLKNKNPNLIFYPEINDTLKEKVKNIWKL